MPKYVDGEMVEDDGKGRFKLGFAGGVGLILLFAILLFVAQNTNRTTVDFLFFDAYVSVWWVVVVTAVATVVLDRLVIFFRRSRRRD